MSKKRRKINNNRETSRTGGISPSVEAGETTGDQSPLLASLMQELLAERKEAAKAILLKILDDTEQPPEELDKVGRFLMGRQMFDEACLVHTKLLEKDPDNPHAHNSLGISLIMAGLEEMAGPHLEAAVRLDPNKPVYLTNLAKQRFMRKDWAQALELLERVLMLVGISASASQIMELIRECRVNLQAGAPAAPSPAPAPQDVLAPLALAGLPWEHAAGPVSVAAPPPPAPSQAVSLPAPPPRKRRRLAFLATPNMDSFLGPIIEYFGKDHEVRKVVVTHADQINEALDWADLCWFEWCNEPLIHASSQPRRCKVVCRLHRYEAFTNMPSAVRWENVDLLLAACNSYVLQALRQQVPDLDQRVTVRQVLNGIDTNRYKFIERSRGKEIACVGYLHPRKNPMLLLQCLHELRRHDPDFRLHFAGTYQDPTLQQYLEYQVDRLGLGQSVVFAGWQKDVFSWLADKHYIVSTSIGEGHPFNVSEALATGLKPAIHNFPGAEELYPPEFLFNSVEEFCRIMLEQEYNPRQYRQFIESRYSLEDWGRNVGQLFALLLEGEAADAGPVPPQAPAWPAAPSQELAQVRSNWLI